LLKFSFSFLVNNYSESPNVYTGVEHGELETVSNISTSENNTFVEDPVQSSTPKKCNNSLTASCKCTLYYFFSNIIILYYLFILH
jgi:hypothetical protein